jgi:hypothetical protein
MSKPAMEIILRRTFLWASIAFLSSLTVKVLNCDTTPTKNFDKKGQK